MSKELIMKLVIVLVSALSILGACSYLNQRVGLENDNLLEESAERLIESKLNLPPGSVDLTP